MCGSSKLSFGEKKKFFPHTLAILSTFHASPPSTAPSPTPPSSLTHVHRCIGSHNTTRQILPTSAKLTYLSMYDNSDGVSEHTASPSSPFSLTHVHRCIGSRNTARQILPTSVSRLSGARNMDERGPRTRPKLSQKKEKRKKIEEGKKKTDHKKAQKSYPSDDGHGWVQGDPPSVIRSGRYGWPKPPSVIVTDGIGGSNPNPSTVTVGTVTVPIRRPWTRTTDGG